MARADLTGQRFGRLVAIRPREDMVDGNGGAIWECKCDCGNVCNVPAHALKSGNTQSCGCGNDENRSLIGGRAPHADGTHLGVIGKSETRRDNSTGITGVSRLKSGRYLARLYFQGKTHRLGTYDTLADAAQARREAELEHFAPTLEKHGRSLVSDDEWKLIVARAVEAEKGNGDSDEEDQGRFPSA